MLSAAAKCAIWALIALAIAACATSESVDGESATGGQGGDGTGGDTGGASGDAGAEAGGSAGTTSGGASGASGSGGGSGLGGASCGNPNACASAIDLGSLSGDEGGAVSHGDSGSLFVKLRVTEDNHSLIGEALEAKFSLQVPAGADLDLYAYLNTDSDVSACGTLPYASADSGGTGQNEQLVLAWGDGLTGSGNDDSRTVVIEVAQKSGNCDPWTLGIQGDP